MIALDGHENIYIFHSALIHLLPIRHLFEYLSLVFSLSLCVSLILFLFMCISIIHSLLLVCTWHDVLCAREYLWMCIVYKSAKVFVCVCLSLYYSLWKLHYLLCGSKPKPKQRTWKTIKLKHFAWNMQRPTTANAIGPMELPT